MVFYAYKTIFQIFTEKLFHVEMVYYVYMRTRWGSAYEYRGFTMFEILCTYAVGALFVTGAWVFDSWMMK